MPNATVRANARHMPLTMEDFTLPSQQRAAPTFRRNSRSLTASSLRLSQRKLPLLLTTIIQPASIVRLAMATERTWEVWLRIDAKEVVYVKDLRVRDLPAPVDNQTSPPTILGARRGRPPGAGGETAIRAPHAQIPGQASCRSD